MTSVLDRTMFHVSNDARLLLETALVRSGSLSHLVVFGAILSLPLLSILTHVLFPIWMFLGLMPVVNATIMYSLYAQSQNPRRKSILGLKLPYFPNYLDSERMYKLNYEFIKLLRDKIVSPFLPIAKEIYTELLKGSRESVLNVPFGASHSSVLLDVYPTSVEMFDHPAYFHSESGRRPVILYLYGGAWQFGDKFIYTQLAKNLNSLGYVVVVPNYHKFPNGSLNDMVHDVQKAIEWTFANIERFGGDPDNITIVGHSAGAHLASLALIRNATLKGMEMVRGLEFEEGFDGSRIHGLVLISGCFDIASHYEFEKLRGVEEISPMGRVMGHSIQSFDRASPIKILQNEAIDLIEAGSFSEFLPRHWLLLHGHRDECVPFAGSLDFFEALEKAGVEHVVLKTYEDPDHSKLIYDIMLPGWNGLSLIRPRITPPVAPAAGPTLVDDLSIDHNASDIELCDFNIELTEFFVRSRRIQRFKEWMAQFPTPLDSTDPKVYEEFLHSERVYFDQDELLELGNELLAAEDLAMLKSGYSHQSL